MRNLRKTRKRGGMSISTILECVAPFESLAKCTNEFVKRQNFLVVEVPGDGNCFYHTLAKYYQLSKPPGSAPTPTHQQLRQIVVDKIEEDLDEAKNSIIINTSNIPNNAPPEDKEVLEMAKYLEALEDLREDGIWNSDNADVISQYAAKALNLRIKIYDRRTARPATKRLLSRFPNGREVHQDVPAESAKIICYTFDPDVGDGVGTVHMFRVGNSHYKLLYPKGAPVAPKGRRVTAKKPTIYARKVNSINNTVAKMAAMKLNTRNTNKKVSKPSSPSRGPMTRSKTKVMKSRSPSPKRGDSRNRTSSLENALIKIALQESEEKSKKPKALNEHFFTALDAASFEEK
jgi:hypothetical protein